MHAFCAARLEQLTVREQDFMTSLASWQGQVTEKQLKWLASVHRRLLRQGG